MKSIASLDFARGLVNPGFQASVFGGAFGIVPTASRWLPSTSVRRLTWCVLFGSRAIIRRRTPGRQPPSPRQWKRGL